MAGGISALISMSTSYACFGPVSQRTWTPLDLDPPTKLGENIILNVLVKMILLYVPVSTKVCLIQNMCIVNAYKLASRRMFLLTKGKWVRI